MTYLPCDDQFWSAPTSSTHVTWRCVRNCKHRASSLTPPYEKHFRLRKVYKKRCYNTKKMCLANHSFFQIRTNDSRGQKGLFSVPVSSALVVRTQGWDNSVLGDTSGKIIVLCTGRFWVFSPFYLSHFRIMKKILLWYLFLYFCFFAPV